MPVLVLAEHDNASLKEATLHAITAATKLGGEINVLVAGNAADGAAAAAAAVPGVAKVLRTGEPLVVNEVTDEVLASITRGEEHARALRLERIPRSPNV